MNIPRMFADSNLEKFSDQVEQLKHIASLHEGSRDSINPKGMMNRKARVHILEEGRVPLLLVLGRMDNYIDCELVAGTIKLPVNARLEILEHSGHMGFIEEAGKSAGLVIDFCERVAAVKD
ncbi:MAG: hypothetical protein R2744_09820 [Bacteroidales bacterium]